MQLDDSQLQVLKNSINAETDPGFVALRNNKDEQGMADWYNLASTFVVALSSVLTELIGKVINYVAYAALTTANRGTLTGFLELNKTTFDATKPDVREMLAADTAAGIFSGTLGGQGAATRAALQGIMLRNAKRGERLYATGTGTTGAPGLLVVVGDITAQNISDALRI